MPEYRTALQNVDRILGIPEPEQEVKREPQAHQKGECGNREPESRFSSFRIAVQ